MVALREVDALQGRLVLAAAANVEAQVPAVAAVVEGEDQHAQEVQPGDSSAEEAQQQPAGTALLALACTAVREGVGVGELVLVPLGEKEVLKLTLAVLLGDAPGVREAVGEEEGVGGGVGGPEGEGEGGGGLLAKPLLAPRRHKLVPQSALEAQGSPGELSTQVPVPGLHAAQPCRAALGEQQ